jgi:small-conductance mechanosensitive channel
MSTDTGESGYRREEFSLIAILLLFFIGIVAFSYDTPFDARLFPLVIGTAGILLTLGIAVEQVRRRRADDAPVSDADDAASNANWLFGFVVAALAAMLIMPPLMGYTDRRQLVITALVTVAIVAFLAPYLLNVDLPHGLVGDWLKHALRAS